MKQDALKQPFFAQLLEEQKAAANQQFYPITKPAADEAQTQKYPSDGDDDNWPIPY